MSRNQVMARGYDDSSINGSLFPTADELAKYNKFYDDGAITKQEIESARRLFLRRVSRLKVDVD